MARNQEKANAMLNRFWKAKADEARGETAERPNVASTVQSITLAEKWRTQIVREMSRKVAEIQNGMLGEHRIRDLNDEINKLMREKFHWEKQILELGGQNYMSTNAARLTDADGKAVVGSGGYMYFGAARNLPGVRELLEKKQAEITKRSRNELLISIDADYYGFRDEDDGLLLRVEAVEEEKAVREAIRAWKVTDAERRKARLAAGLADDTPKRVAVPSTSAGVMKAHVPLPSEEDMRRLLLERRKKALLDRMDV